MQTPAIHPSISPPPLAQPHSGASISKLPVNLFASVMGLSGLALAWRLAHGSLGAPALVGEAIGALALVAFVLIAAAYLTKLAKYPAAVQAEFNHPVAGNFFGTIAISVLLLSAIVAPYSTAASQAVWTVGVVATFVLAWLAVSRMLKGKTDAAHVVPAWIIPCVATLDIPVTGGQMPMAWAADINLLAGAVGAVMALVLLTMIFNRLVHGEPLAAGMTPSLFVLMAPFAVGFLAYTSIVSGVDRFAGLLFYFALFMLAVVAPKVFRPGIKFSAAWWAISFPLAALVNAALKYAEFRGSGPLWVVAVLLLGGVSLALVVLTVQTVRDALNKKLFQQF